MVKVDECTGVVMLGERRKECRISHPCRWWQVSGGGCKYAVDKYLFSAQRSELVICESRECMKRSEVCCRTN